LLQDTSTPEAGSESGAPAQNAGASAAVAARARDTTIYVAVNRLHNILYVRSSDETAITQIARVVTDSDRPTPQVLLEMKVLQLDVGDGFGSLFDIGFTSDHVTAGTSFSSLSSPNLMFQVVSDQIQARLKLMESEHRVKVIATPMVTATNTTPAQLFIGEERVIVTGFSQNTTVGSTGATSTYFTAQTQQRDIGTTLRIIPRINSDQTVTLLVQSDDSKINAGGGTLPVSNADGSVQNLAIDTVSTSNIQGVVTAKDGLTVAMGGLIRKEMERKTDKVPVLGDIPGLGFFFRRMENSDRRSELVVLITPHVFFNPTKANAVSRERVAALSAHPDLSSKGLSLGYKDGDAGVQALVTLARAARLADGGMDAAQLNLALITLPADPPIQIVQNATLRIIPRAAWRQGQLYATVATVENLSNQPAQLDPRQLLGAWKAVSFDQPVLNPAGSPQSRTTGYFFSDRPFGQVIASLTRNGTRVSGTSRRSR
jgi:general secretion pathway protein D